MIKSQFFSQGISVSSFKKFVFVILCLIVFFSTLFFYLDNDVFSAEGDSIQWGELSCKAGNPEAFKKCLEEVKNGVFPIIRITDTIECKSKQDCEFSLEEINYQFTIAGISSVKSVIKRTDDFSYSVFNFNKSANITLSDLAFEDGDGSGCPSLGIACKPVISISDSQNIVLRNLRIHGAKEAGVKITNSSSVSIFTSEILDSFKNAVQVSLEKPVEGVIIEGNVFENNGSNAVVYSGKSLSTKPSAIRSNTFKRNHSKAVYVSCTFPCAAGQLLIQSGTTNLLVENNTITEGSAGLFDRFGLYPSGIEVSGLNTQSVVISCNTISNNKGSGIVQKGTVRTNNNTVIQDNKVYGNGIDLNVQSAFLEDNCFYESCRVSCSAIK